MADKTLIEGADATWNPVLGCSVISPGCTNCYAMRLAGTRLKNSPSRRGLTHESKAGPVWNGEVRFMEEWLEQPLYWRRPRTIFVSAHGDLFHEKVLEDWLCRIFGVMSLANWHRFIVLTKRSDAMADFLLCRLSGWPLPNVFVGISAEDQTRFRERSVAVGRLRSAGWRTWASLEPLLGPVDISEFPGVYEWIVSGGESGVGARPDDPDWHRVIRDSCSASRIPYFCKQMYKKGPIPDDLMVRELPV